MATYFDKVEVINLNSRFDGWVEDVNDILSEIDDRSLIKNSVPRLPINKLTQRFRELKYVCLVNELTIIETRRIFKSMGLDENDKEKDYFDDLYDRMLNVPDFDNEEERCEEDTYDDWPINNSDDLSNPARNKPVYGADPDDLDPKDITVIVDCYAMYTPSLLQWLTVHERNGMRKIASKKLFDELKNHPEKDDPAILLSPDSIKTIYPMIINSSNANIRKLLSLKSNPDKSFLKMALLHELGHHTYRAQTINLSEAMAN